ESPRCDGECLGVLQPRSAAQKTGCALSYREKGRKAARQCTGIAHNLALAVLEADDTVVRRNTPVHFGEAGELFINLHGTVTGVDTTRGGQHLLERRARLVMGPAAYCSFDLPG